MVLTESSLVASLVLIGFRQKGQIYSGAGVPLNANLTLREIQIRIYDDRASFTTNQMGFEQFPNNHYDDLLNHTIKYIKKAFKTEYGL